MRAVTVSSDIAPHASVDHPNSKLTEPACPLFLLREPHPWVAQEKYPRPASAGAFGFGGANFHVALEDYEADFLPQVEPAPKDHWGAKLSNLIYPPAFV